MANVDRPVRFFLSLLMVVVFLLSKASAKSLPTADHLLEKMRQNFSITGRYAEVSMNVVRGNRSEYIHFEIFAADANRLRLEVSRPPRVQGSAIVRNAAHLWVALPRLESVRHYPVKSGAFGDQTVFGSDLRLSDLFGSFEGYQATVMQGGHSEPLQLILVAIDKQTQLTVLLTPDELPDTITVEEWTQGDKYVPVRRLQALSWQGLDRKRYPDKLVVTDLVKPDRSTRVEILYWVEGREFPENLFEKPEERNIQP